MRSCGRKKGREGGGGDNDKEGGGEEGRMAGREGRRKEQKFEIGIGRLNTY